MFKKVKYLIAIGLLVNGAFLFANNDNLPVKITKVENEKVNISATNLNDNLELEIRNDTGDLIYSEKFKSGDFSKNYNLKEFEEGSFYLEIKEEAKYSRVPFTIRNGEIVIESSNTETYFKPVVYIKGDEVIVNMLNLDGDNSLQITLLNNESDVLYSAEMEGDKSLGKIMNIEKLERGKYFVVLASNGKQYVESFVK